MVQPVEAVVINHDDYQVHVLPQTELNIHVLVTFNDDTKYQLFEFNKPGVMGIKSFTFNIARREKFVVVLFAHLYGIDPSYFVLSPYSSRFFSCRSAGRPIDELFSLIQDWNKAMTYNDTDIIKILPNILRDFT